MSEWHRLEQRHATAFQKGTGWLRLLLLRAWVFAAALLGQEARDATPTASATVKPSPEENCLSAPGVPR